MFDKIYIVWHYCRRKGKHFFKHTTIATNNIKKIVYLPIARSARSARPPLFLLSAVMVVVRSIWDFSAQVSVRSTEEALLRVSDSRTETETRRIC